MEDYKKTIITPEGKIIRKGWVFYYGFAVPVTGQIPEFKLERDSPINRETVLGIQVQRRISDAQRSRNGNSLVNDNAFLASFLTLKQRNAEVFESIPLDVIWQSTLQGRWYQMMIPDIDMYQSSVLCTNESSLVVGEDYQFIIKYWNTIIQTV